MQVLVAQRLSAPKRTKIHEKYDYPELEWVHRRTHHAPRIHDLRHTFVVRRILLWQQQGIDVDEAMLSLSTYVGHAMQAVPELMAVGAQRFDSCAQELSHA